MATAIDAEPGGAARNGQAMPDVVLAAGVLAAEEVSFLLVGSAALWLRGEPIGVGDVDAVIEPGEANLRRLHEVLTRLTIGPATITAVGRLAGLSIVSALTPYGKIDALLERGRRDWDRLRQGAGYLAIADVPVLVASADDAWALRHRFKK
jgi:hypothetical protein